MFVSLCNTSTHSVQPTCLKCADTLLIALGVMTILGGTLAILAASGVNLGAFNALGSLTHAGGGILAVGGLLVLSLGLYNLCKEPTQLHAPSETPDADAVTPAPADAPPLPPVATQTQATALIPPFASFEALKQERAQRFAVASPRVASSFSTLEIQPLELKGPAYAHSRACHFAQQKLKEQLDTLIQAATHPDHLRQVETFLGLQLSSYNGQIASYNKQADERNQLQPITIQINLAGTINAWSALEELACQPVLTEEIVTRLASVSLPEIVQTQLQGVVRRILTRPALCSVPIIRDLEAKLKTTFAPPPLFADQLQNEIHALFANTSEANLQGEHFAQVRGYVLEELRRYGIEPTAFPLIQDLNKLETTWNSLLLLDVLGIHEKTELLVSIAHSLPDQSFWVCYPLAANLFSSRLAQLFTSGDYATNRVYTVIAPDDQAQGVSLQGALELAQQKLGFQAPPDNDLDMHTGDDRAVALALVGLA
ncbi:MAG: hypothetical protein S4CHLAM2_11700 [Chlamydiales bacterium]|nr:hypothetical protein [Chlamydiales bacterium]